ncbi:universal stress protein [Noviherbaspirillum sp. ST9]|uniref:universal stress protein n=1 Tax=Noviherbaspirillum sp. ST9 TaxID=3401606 RepID=UPI003B58931C
MTTGLKHILAATDFSAPARHAAARAAVIAASHGATLDLVHVASLSPLERFERIVAGIPHDLAHRVVQDARDELDTLAAALRQQHGVTPSAHVATGTVLEELRASALALDTDLIVLGARGTSFMQHLLIGSTAERMVSKSQRPMLVVKQAPHEEYRSVLVPIDLSAASLPALLLARTMAPRADIVLLHAYEVPFEGKLRYAGVDEQTFDYYQGAARLDAGDRLEQLCLAAGFSPGQVRGMVLHGRPLQHILEQEQELECDLIVMGKHGDSALEDLLLGSVTKHVLAQSQCDVLVSCT